MNVVMKKPIEPTTAAVLVAGILAIALVAVFGDAKMQVAIAGGIAVIAAAFAKSLLRKTQSDEADEPASADDGPSGPPTWLVVLVLGAALRESACASAKDPRFQAEESYRAEQVNCAATEPTNAAIDACRARVRVKWNVPARDGGAR